MNAKLEKYLEDARVELAAAQEAEARERADFLLGLGLCDEEREYPPEDDLSEREAMERGYTLRETTEGGKRYYRIRRTPIEVTDEEYAQLRSIEAQRQKLRGRAPEVERSCEAQPPKPGDPAFRPSDVSRLLYWMAWIFWIPGAFASAVLSKGLGNLEIFLISMMACLFMGFLMMAVSRVLACLEHIERNTERCEPRLKENGEK